MTLEKNNGSGSIRTTKIYRFASKFYRYWQLKYYRSNKGKGYLCPGCNLEWKRFRAFPKAWMSRLEKYGWPYTWKDAETLNYFNYTCYGCGITDRDRLYILFLRSCIQPERTYDIIEFAPTPSLSDFFKTLPNTSHRTADLFMSNVDDRVDLQDLRIYENNKFDIFICSHILEHVDDDIKAMKELYRILKPGGIGIAMVPIVLPVTKTVEDPAIEDVELKIKYFGQSDHVRLYAKNDFISRLESVGFKVKLYGSDYFGVESFSKTAITENSVLYVVYK